MIDNNIDKDQEIVRLKAQVVALEQLLEVHEQTTLDQSDRLEQALQALTKHTAELEDARGFLDSIVDNIPIMVVVKDAQELKFVRWNKYGEKLIGLDQQVFIGKSDYDFFPKEEADFFIAKDREVLAGGKLIDIPEEPIQTASGETRLLHTQKVPILGADGKPKYLLAIAEDITERKQAEDILLKRARELETVAKVGTAAATILDIDQLLQEVVDLTKSNFNLYHAHVYLLNQAENTLVLAAGAGEVGRQMVSQSWSIPLEREQSLVAQAARNHQGVIVNNVRQEPDFLPNPLLPDTQAEMAIPLIVGDQVLGVLDMQADVVDYFTEEDVRIETILAGQIAVALQNARSFAEQQQARLLLNDRIKELNCLNEIGREIVETPLVSELLEWVSERIPPAMRYSELCVAAIEYQDQTYGRPEAIELPCQIVHALRIGNEVVGRVYIAYIEKREFLDEESALIGGIAGRLSGYIESRRLFEQTQEAQAESELLYSMANQLIQSADPSELLEAASSYARRLGASGGTLLYIDNDPQGNPEWAEIIAQWSVVGEGLPTGTRFYLPEFPLSTLWISHPDQPLLIADVLTDERVDPATRKILVQVQSSTFALVPLNIKSRWVGLLSFNWSEPYSFTKHDQRIFSAIAQQTVSVVDAVRASQQTQVVLVENQQQKELLNKIIEFMPVGVFAKDVQNDYRFTIWNSKLEELLGVKREDMLGKTDYDYTTKELADKYRQADVAAVEAAQVIDIPVEEITTSRGTRLAHTTKLPIYDTEGKPEILLVVLEDITERKQAEETLRENEARLADALATAQLGNWELDVATQIFTFNDQFYSLFHTTAEQEGGYQMPVMQYAQKFVHPDDAYLVGIAMEQALKATDPNHSIQVEHRIIRADGSEGYIIVRFRVVKDEQGRTVKTVGANQDITERKLAEEALRKSQERLSEALETAKLAYWEFELESQDLTFNDQFYALLGTTVEQAGGYVMPAAQYAQKYVHPGDAFKIAEAIQKLAKTDDPHYIDQIEYRIIRADAKEGYLIVQFRKDQQGQRIRAVGVAQDITERKQSELERERLLAEVETAYRQFVRREWQQFLSEQHQGGWHIEHQGSSGLNVEHSRFDKKLIQLQNEVISEGKIKAIAGVKDNGHSVEPTIVAPIVLRGQIIGTLSLQDIAPDRQWSDEEMTLVETVSEQLALTVENLRLFGDTQKQAAREQLTRQITDHLRAASDIDTIIQTGLTELAKVLNVSRSYVKLTTKPIETAQEALIDDDRERGLEEMNAKAG